MKFYPPTRRCFNSVLPTPLAMVLLAVSLLVSGCEPPELAPTAPAPAATSAASQQAVGENPFSVALMRRAYTNLKSKLAGGKLKTTGPVASEATAARPLPGDCLNCPEPDPGPSPVQPTHLYLRFKAADTNQLADLYDAGFRLSWEPMDESVAAATTVNFQSDDIAWIYTVVPVGTALPTSIQREQIQELFLFNAEDGDAKDVDPWEPAPDPVPGECQTQYDPTCNCYLQCPLARTAKVGKTIKQTNQTKATQKLKDAGISPLALYNEAMRLSGHLDEALDGPAAGQARTTATRYRPSGKIQVEDTDFGAVPLRDVEVKSRRWFQFGSTFTDSQGNFSISTSYKNMAKVSLQFKNSFATTRGIVADFKPWQAVLPINSELGTYQSGAMQNISYTITHQGGLDKRKSKGASTWTAATLFNTIADDNAYSAAHGIPGPLRGINVWLLPDFPRKDGPGATPMLRKIASTAPVSQVVDFLLVASGLPGIALIKIILQRQLPDVCIRYSDDGGALDSYHLNPLLYHELGHVQHYNQVVNGFWNSYIYYIVIHGGYGNKSDSDAGRIAISEGWGNYTERLFTIDRYQGTGKHFFAERALFELEEQEPTDGLSSYNKGWLVYRI